MIHLRIKLNLIYTETGVKKCYILSIGKNARETKEINQIGES